MRLRAAIALLTALAGAPLSEALAAAGRITLEASHDGSFHAGVTDYLDVVIDRQAPTIEIISPPNEAVVGSNQVTVTGVVSDSVDPTYQVSGASPLMGEILYEALDEFGVTIETGSAALVDGRFTVSDVTLGTGTHIIRLTAVDVAGNVSQYETVVHVDPNPEVTLVGAADGQAFLTTQVTLDLDFAASTTLLSVNDIPDGRALGPGLVPGALEIPLELGANPVRLLLDAGSGPYSLSFTLFRVESFADPAVTSIADGGFTNQPTLSVNGTVPLGTQLVEVNGILATLAGDGVSFSADVPLQEGANAISVTAFPQASTTQIHVTRDTQPPVVRYVVPDDGSATMESELRIGAVLEERAHVTVVGPAGSVADDTRPEALSVFPVLLLIHLAELDPLPLADGANDLVLTATDVAGNATVVNLQIVKTAAALVLSSPADGSEIAALRVTPTVQALTNVTIDALYVSGRRVPIFEGGTLTTGFVTLPEIPLAPGPNEIRIVYHRAGGPSEVTSFAYQSAATAAMTLTGQVVDDETGAAVSGALVSVSVNGITQIVVTGQSGAYSLAVESGSATVVATAEGFSTRSTTASGGAGDTVVADLGLSNTGVPGLMNEVAIVVPPDGTVTDFEKLTVVGHVLNPTSAVMVNGIAAEVVGNRFTARSVPLAMGANAINVSASALGAPAATTSVQVERANEPVLAVKVFSPPDGVSVPGGGLVVRGFVSGKHDVATRVLENGIVAVDEGVFQLNDVFRSSGDATIRAEAATRDGLHSASSQVRVEFGSSDPALILRAAPESGTPPLSTTLTLEFGASPFDVGRIDFDLDGDAVLDVVNSQTAGVSAEYTEARPVVARGFVTTSEGAELSAPSRIGVHLPHETLREFAQGNPVDLATGPSDTLYVLDGAAGSISRYDAGGTVLDSFGVSGAGSDQLMNPQALAVAPDGRIFVADTGNNRVQVYTPNGVWERTIGAGGALTAPRGVAVVEGRLLVSDTGHNRVRAFELGGAPAESAQISVPRGVAGVVGFGALVASPAVGVRSLIDGTFAAIEPSASWPDSLGSVAPVDIAAGGDLVLLADAGGARTLVLSPQLAFRRAISGFSPPPIAVLPAAGREAFFVADGSKVIEIELPIDAPIAVMQSLKSKLLAGDIPGALTLIHPLQRDLFQEIYTAIEPDLPIEAAAMTDFFVERLSEDHAIVRIRTIEDSGGTPVESTSPVHLVRKEDGTWQIFDY